MVVDRLGRGEVGIVGELDGLVDARHRGLVELGDVVLAQVEPLRVARDRVALAPLLDLLLVPVLLRIGHRVAAEAVGLGLDEDRPAVLADGLDRLAEHLVGVHDVHPVAAHPGHAEALAALVQVGLRGVALERGAHAELVVGDHEDHRQLPQRGDVERLPERALVGGAVTEHADRDLLGPAVVARQRDPRGDRQVAADDPVAAHEAPLAVEHVHRAPAPAGDAGLAPEQLGHHALGIGPARQRVAMRTVGRDQEVLVAHRPHGADDRRLLADRQVQEAADLGLRVHLARALLEAADQQHRFQPFARLVGHCAFTYPGRPRRCAPGPPPPTHRPPPPGRCSPARTPGRPGRRMSAARGGSALPEVRNGAVGAARLLSVIPVPAKITAKSERSWTWRVGPGRARASRRPRPRRQPRQHRAARPRPARGRARGHVRAGDPAHAQPAGACSGAVTGRW